MEEVLAKREMKVSRAKKNLKQAVLTCSLPSCHTPPNSNSKEAPSVRNGGNTNAGLTKRTQCGYNNWRKMSRIQHATIAYTCTRVGRMETVLRTSCPAKNNVETDRDDVDWHVTIH